MEKIFRPSPNSFKNTFCAFKEVDVNLIKGWQAQFQSKAGSSYYYTKEGMYRYSNHWGRLANSKWRLIPMVPATDSKKKLGFALWEEFYPDNAEDKIYYLKVDYLSNTVNYEHKNNPDYDGKAILRTSFETTKKIKQIRNLQQLSSWAKYFDYEDLDVLRKQIIEELVYTNKTLEEIKAELLP
ncbi:hypothetical protein SLW70_11395 [Flavobacterium sp. NG2]|uniref:hypothetical protein n=1 Tax=Flavobacterium sp. NG2 TaxID=3097547 RepID=UPI002A7FB4DD|nr:hypothetical protein [Flavobacterium sp. NG2]WPR70537.1 hypothetical protein SLW70_11395 [Flavobacterium sp. NG2]